MPRANSQRAQAEPEYEPGGEAKTTRRGNLGHRVHATYHIETGEAATVTDGVILAAMEKWKRSVSHTDNPGIEGILQLRQIIAGSFMVDDLPQMCLFWLRDEEIALRKLPLERRPG